MIREIRDFADRYNWIHPSILATFVYRPPYQAAFKNTWLTSPTKLNVRSDNLTHPDSPSDMVLARTFVTIRSLW